jgi:hypothetical protein
VWSCFRVGNDYSAELPASSLEMVAVIALAAAAALRFINRVAALPTRPANLAHTFGPPAE